MGYRSPPDSYRDGGRLTPDKKTFLSPSTLVQHLEN